MQKMKKTRGKVSPRITTIPKRSNHFEDRGQPPSYEEAIATTPTETPQTYNDLHRMTVNSGDTNSAMEAGLVYMYENVKLYFVSPSGEEVSLTSTPQTLKIFLIKNEGLNVPQAILQIGDWVFPLNPGASPCYRSDFGTFILPNINAETPGSSIRIILPSDAGAKAYDILEGVLHGIVGVGKQEAHKELSEKISDGIVAGASLLSRGLVSGAEKIGSFLNQNPPKLINGMRATDQPIEIPSNVAQGMQIAETATNKAAQVTGFVAEQVGVATMKLGRFLAPHIQKQGTRLLASGFDMSEADASNKMKGVITVAAGAAEGFSTVYCSLENSASILGASLKDYTVKVVEHKYGHPAGEFAGDTLSTMGNVYHISRNARVVQPKHLVRQAAKEAGKAMFGESRKSYDVPLYNVDL